VGALLHQQAAYVGVADDGNALAALLGHVGALDALLGVFGGELPGALGDAEAFGADRQARRIHHHEHGFQPAAEFADQVAGGAAVVAVDQGGGRAAMYAELVFDGGAIHVVVFARIAVGVEDELGHQEQRQPLDAGRGVGRAGQYEVDDVGGHVVVAVGDEDLLAVDAEAAVGLGHGAAGDGGEVGAGLGFGDVHRAGPFARHQPGQPGGFQVVGAGDHQRLDGAVGERHHVGEGQVGRLPHFVYRHRQEARQPLTAVFGRAGQGHPAAVGELFIGGRKAGDGEHFALAVGAGLPARAVPVAHRIEGRQDVAGKAAGLFEHGVDQFGVAVGVGGQGADRGAADQLMNDKAHVAQGGLVVGHSLLRKYQIRSLAFQ
jgi:hypothetical protein